MRPALFTTLICVLCVTSLCTGFGQDEPLSPRKVVSKVQPQYPPLARAAHVSGMTKLLVHVSNSGKVESVDVLGGHPLLAQAAVAAVEEWKWEPSSHATEVMVEVKFVLPE